MNYLRFTKRNLFLLTLTILLAINPLFSSVSSQTSTSNPKFTVSQLPDRITANSPVYDNKTNLYMSVTSGVQRLTANPFINLSYIDASNRNVVFSTLYIFRQFIEYTQTNTSNPAPDANTIDRRINIGINDTAIKSLSNMGYNPIQTNTSTFQNQILHTFILSTKDGVFSLELNIPESTVYPNDIQVDVPGLYFNVKINNFPFRNSGNKLSLNMAVITSSYNTIDILPSNQIEIYKAYTGLNSTFYWQNGIFTGQNSDFLNPENRFISSDFVFADQNSSSLTMTGYAGQIDTTPLLPISSSSSVATGTDPINGLLNYKIQSDYFNINTTLGDVAVTGTAIAGVAGLIALIYYFIKKYLIYIAGFVITLTVSIYLPTRKVNAIEALHHEKRREIMDELHNVAEKGLLMKELKELVNLPQTTLLWHLDVLQEFSFITKVKIHKQIVIISNDFLEKFDPRVKELELSFLSDQGEKFRQFINIKGRTGAFNLEGVTDFTDWHPKTAKRHLKRMVNLGIINFDSNSKLYTVEPEFYNYFLKN